MRGRRLAAEGFPYLCVVVCVYAALAVAYGVIAPLFESPDEVGHFFAVKYIADYGGLPSPEKEPSTQYMYGQEGTQPPLYYLVGAAVLRLSGVYTEDVWGYLRVNPHTTCGSPHLAGNKGFLAHDPAREAFPWRASVLALHLLRLYSTALGVVTVLGVYAIARACFPTRRGIALMAAALTALNPQFLFVSAGVNNDNLLVPLSTWSLYLMLRTLRWGLKPVTSIFMGVLIGLAALTKVGGVLLLPLAGLSVLFSVWCRRYSEAATRPLSRVTGGWTLVVGHGALITLPALAVGGWWYARNASLYGDPALIEHHLAIVSRRDPTPLVHILHEVPSIFYSYWGRFTCDISPGAWYYVFWGLIVLGGLVGLGVHWREFSVRQRVSAVLLGVWFAFVFVGWFRWNLIASGVQGRLLFPAAASVSVLVGSGLSFLLSRWRWPEKVLLLGWLGLALWVPFGFIRPTFMPPPRYPRAEGLEIPHRMNGGFIDGSAHIRLLGYDVRPNDLEAGETLEVTLYLSTDQPLTATYSLGLWLVSAVPGDTTRLAGLDTWPGNGNYPTTAWRPGEVVEDTYLLSIPAAVPRAQAWMLQLNAYRMGEHAWLPFIQDGHKVGERAILDWVRVGASEPLDIPPEVRLEPAPAFGEAIALRGARIVQRDEANELRLTLWWEAWAAPGADYTVFVHLVDADGRPVADGDGPPLWGGFPTRMWRRGDRVLDEHVVLLPPNLSPGNYTLSVGLYDPLTGVRLPALRGTERFSQDAVPIGTWLR